MSKLLENHTLTIVLRLVTQILLIIFFIAVMFVLLDSQSTVLGIKVLSYLDWLTFITVLSICVYHWHGSIGLHRSLLATWENMNFQEQTPSETLETDELVQSPGSSHLRLLKLLNNAPRIKNQLPVIDNVLNNAKEEHINRMQTATTSNTLVGLIGTITGIFIALNVIDPEKQSVDIFEPLRLVMLSSLTAYLFNIFFMSPWIKRASNIFSGLKSKINLLILEQEISLLENKNLAAAIQKDPDFLLTLNDNMDELAVGVGLLTQQFQVFNTNFVQKIADLESGFAATQEKVENINSQYTNVSKSVEKLVQSSQKQLAARQVALNEELNAIKYGGSDD